MSVRDRIAPYLPFLRRYARILTGSQPGGDAYVRTALEALLSGRHVLDEKLGPRAGLYKLFHQIWASSNGRLERAAEGSVFAGDTPEERLQGLQPTTREALLLAALEGFSSSEVGQILGVSTRRAEQLAAEAQLEIERELATEVLIIEDEALIALDLQDLAEELGHRVVGIARTREEAVALARRHPPGLVLADIHLADDSSGIDAVGDIVAKFDAPVIFVTAFPERLLTGERSEPAYLMTKPFDRLALKATISQALFFHRKKEAA
jgi:DNA-directed RNA polymerase specialized sigma24 family protein